MLESLWMKTPAHLKKSFAVQFAVRPLTTDGTKRASEIERDAFPSLKPPTAFHQELNNKRANYFVAHARYQAKRLEPTFTETRHLVNAPHKHMSPLLHTQLSPTPQPNRHAISNRNSEVIVGFQGTWYMTDEAHIVTVGVASDYRGKGIGELLLIAALCHAICRGSIMATLEVRPSNIIARTLYLKYGFTDRGMRNNYYADNREDAIIMTTDHIQSREFRSQLNELRKDHGLRWGWAEIHLK